jgi:carboxypeptidase Taq
VGPSSNIDRLREQLAEISDLGAAGALLDWDQRTKMPPAGAEARAEQQATLARIGHGMLVSDQLGALIDAASQEVEGLPYDSTDASLVRVARRDWEKARRVPAELRGEITRSASLAEQAWVGCRERSDFAGFLPHLERNIELRRRYIDCFEGFGGFEHPYDPLLDDFEPGMSTAELRTILGDLRDAIRPLVVEVSACEQIDDVCLHGTFPLGAQEALAREVVRGLPLEADTWRLDPTVHPFATAISPGDLRITTRFDPGYIGTALWSVIHETGHAMYENGVGDDLRRSPLSTAPSLGFHESQSRLWENWIGRGRPYLEHLLPRLRELFGNSFATVDSADLYRAANRIEPSLIRVEADQVTYNLHVVLRFEIELDLFEGRLEAADLPDAWNARMGEYLGLEVPDDASGVLQDVHWAGGAFGYFPTYALGNLLAAQIWDAATAELGELDSQVAAGQLEPLRDWLRERVYRHGAKLMPGELIERVVGGPIEVGPYIRQLRARAAEIYGMTWSV